MSSHDSNLRTQHLHAHACKCWKTHVIHTHVIERLDSTNKQNAHTRVHMYTPWWVWSQVYTVVSRTPVPVLYLSALAYQTSVWCSLPPTPQHVHMHASKHTWNDGTAATARESDADAGRSSNPQEITWCELSDLLLVPAKQPTYLPNWWCLENPTDINLAVKTLGMGWITLTCL